MLAAFPNKEQALSYLTDLQTSRHLESENYSHESHHIEEGKRTKKWAIGIIPFRPGAIWIGVHYSKLNRRFCINIIPFVTIWVCKPNGIKP